MRVALDISSVKLGWAIYEDGAQDPRWGILRLPKTIKGEEGRIGRKAEAMRQHLRDLHTIEPIRTIFYEAQFIGGKIDRNVVERLCGMAGVVDWFAHMIGADVWKVEISSWRKHFLLEKARGVREDLKAAGVRAAHARGWMVSSDDEGDALGVLDYGLHCLGIKPPWATRHLFGGRLEAAE